MFTCFKMICAMDKLKTVLPSAEEREEDKDSFGSKREAETCHEDGEPGGNTEKEEAQETTPHAAGQTEEDSFHSSEKKPLAAPIPVNKQVIKDPVMKIVGFNLNNEVVKMRKEVKRVRALIIRKLTRRICALKKKKGKDADVEKNQRRAIRLLEEIQAMKVLPPDVVTKTALQKNLNLNQVCKNPKSTISDRGLTRIATHPQFIKRIDSIKAALKAFKEGRIKNEGQEAKVKGQNKKEKFPPAKERQSMKKKPEKTVQQPQTEEIDNVVSTLEDLKDAAVGNPKEESSKAHHSADTDDDIVKEMTENKSVISVKDMAISNIPGPVSKKKPNCNTASKVLQQKTNEEESDLEPLDDEEKEYFDDSTEERFHRQSSESEESDDDDFFVGKVSKLKKKTKPNNEDKKKEVKVSPSKQDRSELPVVESKPKAKTAQLQTVFCPTLSVSGMDKGASRGRGKGKLGGKETVRGDSHWKSNYNKQPTFQKQGRGTGCNTGSMSGDSHQESQLTGSRAWAQGRGVVIKQKVSRNGADCNHQSKTQALHPSWEASKKRKEQQGQILAFQGKKIKFDDDDDDD